MNEDTADGTGGRPGLRWLAASLAVAALAGTALLAAACSGGSPSSRAGSSAAQQTAKQMAVFATCMRGHGQPNFYYANPQSVASSPTK